MFAMRYLKYFRLDFCNSPDINETNDIDRTSNP